MKTLIVVVVLAVLLVVGLGPAVRVASGATDD